MVVCMITMTNNRRVHQGTGDNTGDRYRKERGVRPWRRCARERRRKKAARRQKVLPFVAQLLPCLIGMEASGGAHFWAREFSKLGHTVKLMPPQFVKPYVQSQKNDPNDAVGICEAVGRPRMRGVPMKSVTQQDVQALHRIRERQITARTALLNQIRGLLAEYGIVIPQRASQVRHKLPFILEDAENGLTATAHEWLQALAEELQALDQRIATTDQQIERVFEADEACQRLAGSTAGL